MKTRCFLLAAITSFLVITSCASSTQTVKDDKLKEEPEQISETKKTKEKVELTDEMKYEINKNSSFAQSKRQQKKYREMVEYINEIIEIDPEFEHARDILLYWRGGGYEELGLRDSAITDYENFSKMRPDHSQVLIKLDYMYATNGEIEEAIDVVQRMIEIDDEDKSLYKKLGTYYYQLAEELKENDPYDPEIEEHALAAIDALETYIEYFPDDEDANNLLTYLVSKFLDREAYKLRLEENLRLNPDDSRTIERLSSIYYDEGQTEKCSELLEKLLERKPDDLKAIRKLIKIYRSDVNKAIAYNKKAIKLDPDNEAYNISLAKLYTEIQRFSDARAECIKARSKNSKNSNIYRTWASVYTSSIAACSTVIEYQDKLVFTIAYGLYEKAGDTRRMHAMKESGQVPSKSDFFTNKSTRFPERECYNWINPEWDEVAYIETYLKTL